MARLSIALVLAALLAFPFAGSATANHPHTKRVQGPSCGGKFTGTERCSFRFKGGQLYVAASMRGVAPPAGAATVLVEARSRVTGQRRLLLSCTTAAGGCSAGGSFDTVEHLEKGQRLFCTVEAVGRGTYECGTIVKKKAH